jgi:hypothetical protein
MRSTILVLSLLLPAGLSGQANPSATDYTEADMNMLNPNRMLLRTKSAGAYGTKGSPYVFSDFKKGNMYYSNQQRVSNILLNYDCHNNQLVYTTDGSVYLLNSSQINFFEAFTGGDTVMLFEQVFVENLKKRIFLRVLYNENSILYKRYYKDFKEADYGGAYSQDRRYDEYHDREAFYIKTGEKELQVLKPKKKFLLELLGDKNGELEKYLKQEKPDLKSDEGLVQVIQFYDSME